MKDLSISIWCIKKKEKQWKPAMHLIVKPGYFIPSITSLSHRTHASHIKYFIFIHLSLPLPQYLHSYLPFLLHRISAFWIWERQKEKTPTHQLTPWGVSKEGLPYPIPIHQLPLFIFALILTQKLASQFVYLDERIIHCLMSIYSHPSLSILETSIF